MARTGFWLLAVLPVLAWPIPARCQDNRRDFHSFSNPEEVRVRHLDLHLRVDFGTKTLSGTATWTVERMPGSDPDAPLVLDTRDLTVKKVEAGGPEEIRWSLGEADPVLGRPLTISLPPRATKVKITYKTSPSATALQWVPPSGTADKRSPFLYSQSEAIHARSWIPCQDSPGVRATYEAAISSPTLALGAGHTRAMMAAEMLGGEATDRFLEEEYRMLRPIPSYLIALAVGDLAAEKTGPRTAVFAEPSVIKQAAWEFADTEKMVEAAERLFGPYRWDRYDILVLPPSFPFGGMENPRLTFATPTVITGDRSQVALVAHELAHSWSGNLVTNATWSDFWLNEGFTVYLERRIVEDVFGKDRAEMEAVLGREELDEALKTLPPKDQVLHINLDGRNPDSAITAIPYEKGALFLKAIEEQVGRDRMDAFLKGYFDDFAFQSITTADFERYLLENLLKNEDPPLDLHAWLYEPGLPDEAPRPQSARFSEIEKEAKAWLDGHKPASEIDAEGWSTLEWLHFLRALPTGLDAENLEELDQAFSLTKSGNAEVLTLWLERSIQSGYHAADARVAEFLGSVGRLKFLVPLYQALLKTPEGRRRARQIFEDARPSYHPIAADSIGKLIESN